VPIGTVKWFNNAKGYGFIEPQTGDNDIFVHYSTIEMEGYKSLKAGQDVTFELSEGPKGVHATDITPAVKDESEKGEEE
jgi:CspA family cold shock protein